MRRPRHHLIGSSAVTVTNHSMTEAEAELANLRRWKAEATEVLDAWEKVWVTAGKPGPLGSSKAQAVLELLELHGFRGEP